MALMLRAVRVENVKRYCDLYEGQTRCRLTFTNVTAHYKLSFDNDDYY